ncbi:hypothetical protein M404DRAFT_30870 [Pisolithus tinctorius Marx 270]|uniref:Uncharacterized protein n=1 Tax=Pisolithus tinctorius Marx 270 TaxID=870435 RepID=A0A0C3ND92_PISTI|nr:hypothetical protein M404DRAFT_30870 [Pisolithus tinctorius Marx 270]
MPSMIKSISPFYNHDSAAPPPFPTMLTDQLELLGKASCSKSSGLLADKVLPPAHTLSSKKVHVSEVLAQSQKSTLAPEFIVASKTPATWFGSPYLKRAPSQACSESTSTPSTSSDKEEVASSDNDLTSSIQLELKVPKPPGEPGHPGRGSYTLETVLNLNQKVFSKFKKYMHALINKHLDTKKCLSVQDPALLKVICQKQFQGFLAHHSSTTPASNDRGTPTPASCWPPTPFGNPGGDGDDDLDNSDNHSSNDDNDNNDDPFGPNLKEGEHEETEGNLQTMKVLDSLARAIQSLAWSSCQDTEGSSGSAKVQEPDTFDGTDPKKLQQFLIQCELTFQNKP